MKMLLFLALNVLILITRFVWGVDFRITNNTDSGAGSLRQAIEDLNTSPSSQTNTVTFDPDLGSIQLLSDLPLIEVEGMFTTSTGDSLVIDGNTNQYRIFSAPSLSVDINVPTTSSLTLSGIFDSGALIRSGAGVLILDGSNTYTGGTVIVGGLLAVSGTGTLAPTGAVTISSGGILDISAIGSTSQTISDLSGSGGSVVLGGETLIAGSTLSTTFGGIISGTGSFVKQGSGTLTLTGSNIYTGGTKIHAGTLALSGIGALASTGGIVTSSGGIFDISAITAPSQTIGNLSGLGGSVVLGTKTLILEDTLSGIYAGIISGTGAFIKQGSQMLILIGSNTYSGGTTVNGGILQGNTTSLQGDITNNASLIFDEASTGTYSGVISGSGSLTKQNTGTLILSSANTYSGGTTIIGGVLQGNTSSLQGDILDNASLIFDQASTGTYSGAITGTGTVIKENTGTLILTGANTYSGETTIIGGILQGNTTSLQGGIMNNASLIFDQAITGTYSGVLEGTGTLIKQNTGMLILGNGTLHTGGTVINAGTLFLSGALASTGSVTINAGTFDISSISGTSQTIGDLSGLGGNIILGTKMLVAGTSNNTSYAGVISGTGSFTKQESGTLTLSNINTYTGETTISSGGLALSGNGSLATDNSIFLSAETIFDISGANGARTIGDLSGVAGSQVLLGANALTIETSNNTSYAGGIGGTGALTKQGSGTVMLTGVNTYSGGTTVSTGVLQGNTTGLQGNIVNNASVVFDQPSTGTYSGVLSGSGAITKQNTGTVILTGDNTYSGGTMITLGTLALSGSGTIASTGTVVINVGSFDISDVAASSQTIGALVGGGNVFLGEKNLITGTANTTAYVGIISGSGSLIKQGSGILTLSGSNTYSGGTTINAGTLALAGSETLSSIGAVTINAGSFDISAIIDPLQIISELSGLGGEVILGDKTLIQDTSNNTSYAGSISGTGAFIKQGLGTLILTSDSSGFLGTVSVNEGALMIKGKIGGELNVSANAVLAGTGSVENVLNSGKVKPGASIGTLTVSGNYTQGASGELDIEINETGATSLLQVGGIATLNGTLHISPDPGVYLEGTTYTFLTAGSVIGQFSNSFSDIPLDYQINYFPNQVQLTLLGPSIFLPPDLDGNAKAVTDYLFCPSFDFGRADLVTVVGALLSLPSNQYEKALNRLTPSQFGALALTELENNFSIANTFFITGADQRSCCYACKGTNIWVNPLGFVYSQKSRPQLGQEAIGFTNHTYGVTAGIDHLFSNNWKLGFGFGYSYSHLHWKTQAGKARADSGYLGPYMGYDCGHFYFDFLVLGAGNFYDIDRKIVFPGLSRVASSHPTTWNLSEVVLVGFRLEPSHNFFVQPEVLLDQLNSFQEGFKESGADSVNLSVKRKYSSFLRSLINLKFAKEWVFCNMCVAPSANVGWLRTTPLAGRHYTASFPSETFCSPNFSATSFNQVIDQVLVGAQFLISSQGGFSMSLGYDGRFGEGTKVNEVSMAVGFRF